MNVRSFCSARILSRALLGLTCFLPLTTALTGCLSRSLTGLTIQPSTGNTTVVPGVSAQFKAYGTYTESGKMTKVEDVTNLVTWSTTIPAVATVNASGVATGVDPGYTSIIATMEGTFQQLTASSNIVVDAPSGGSTGATTRTLTQLAIIPSSQTVTSAGETGQFLAIGTYSAAPFTVDLTNQASWQSSDVKVATVDAAGLATAVDVGQTTITALAKASDGSVLSATGTLQFSSGSSGAVTLPTLTVYGAGSGAGMVTGVATAPDGTQTTPINCTYSGPSNLNGAGTPPGDMCTATVPVGTVVKLTAILCASSNPACSSQTSVFGGWSSTCSETSIHPPQCTTTVTNNTTVGAIFDPQQ